MDGESLCFLANFVVLRFSVLEYKLHSRVDHAGTKTDDVAWTSGQTKRPVTLAYTIGSQKVDG